MSTVSPLRLKESEQQQEAKHTHQRYTKAGCEEIEKPQVCIACGAACVGYRMNQNRAWNLFTE
jgi:hypothetical protein